MILNYFIHFVKKKISCNLQPILQYKVQYVHNDDKGKKNADADKMNGIFHLSIYRFSPYPFDRGK